MKLSFSLVIFKQKTAYEMRISDWSSDVCSSDLGVYRRLFAGLGLLDHIVHHAFHHGGEAAALGAGGGSQAFALAHVQNRKSVVEGKRVSVRVDIGGRRTIKKIQEIVMHLVPATECDCNIIRAIVS